jgi:hypothetical protein
MNLEVVQAAFLDELDKIAKDLTEAAREHIAPKNFAVSAKASNTGKPAYPIPDKAHARAALGFSAMHHDKKDAAEVRKDVAAKFPGMVHEKKAFSLTEAGHKFDSKAYGSERDAAGTRREARSEYAKDHPGLRAAHTVGEVGGLLNDVDLSLKGVGHVSGLVDKLRERHMDYASKKHEGGRNAYNPLGGLLTETAREKKHKEKSSCMDAHAVKHAFAIVKKAFNVGEALRHGATEAGPAAGATLGAALMGGMGKNPLTGAAAGYGLGSLPEMILNSRKGKKAA